MARVSNISRILRRFRRDESGVALAELAITLPITLLLFGVIVEGCRMLWSYQTAISGVRDAARYLGRVAPADICTTSGSVAGYTATLTEIVNENIHGSALFPAGITVTSVTPALTCIAGAYRVPIVPVIEVTATVSFTFPFAPLLAFGGHDQAGFSATIADQQRVYGS